MQKRWSVNSMMLSFVAFALVLIAWVLFAFKMGFGSPIHFFSAGKSSFFGNILGKPGSILGHNDLQGQASIPLITTGPPFHFPTATLAYFQFVFAAITPILMLGSVLGRVNFKAWIPFVVLWSSLIYTVNAFTIWGGGWFAQHGALDYSGGYVIHLAAGVSGFVAAAVIGPRLQRDREIDAPNNLLMVATGAGLLWLGWNGFNGGDPYYAGASASAAVLNTNLCTAVAFLGWVAWDYITRRKPTLIGSVNGMITGLVAITPAAGYVNGWGAIAIGAIGCTIVYFALNYLSRVRPFRRVDDTLGVVYTHGFAGLSGGLLVGVFADPNMIVYPGQGKTASIAPLAGLIHGSGHLLKEQAWAALWVICFCAVGTFILLKLVGLFVPLRMKEADMEMGDLAVHGHEVYPSDVPSLGFPNGRPQAPTPPAKPAEAPG
jgi:Amt family ammonium transporter